MQSVQMEGRQIVPSKVVCIGRNYAAHAAELGNAIPDEMVVFCKPNSAIGDTLLSARGGETIHFETEICFLVEAGQFAAIGVGLDLTRRETQSRLKAKGLPWERAKSFDGAALFSEFVRFSGDMGSLHLTLHIDGKLAQSGGVPLMLFPPHQMQQDLASFMTMQDGDVLMTGTPAGVGPVRAGAVFEAAVFAGDELLVKQRWVAV